MGGAMWLGAGRDVAHSFMVQSVVAGHPVRMRDAGAQLAFYLLFLSRSLYSSLAFAFLTLLTLF